MGAVQDAILKRRRGTTTKSAKTTPKKAVRNLFTNIKVQPKQQQPQESQQPQQQAQPQEQSKGFLTTNKNPILRTFGKLGQLGNTMLSGLSDTIGLTKAATGQENATKAGVLAIPRLAKSIGQGTANTTAAYFTDVMRKPTERAKTVTITNPLLKAIFGDTIVPISEQRRAAAEEFGPIAGPLLSGISEIGNAQMLGSIAPTAIGAKAAVAKLFTKPKVATSAAIQTGNQTKILNEIKVSSDPYGSMPKAAYDEAGIQAIVNGKFNPKVAVGRIADVKQKLNMVRPGLGEQLRVDPANLTPQQLYAQAEKLVRGSQNVSAGVAKETVRAMEKPQAMAQRPSEKTPTQFQSSAEAKKVWKQQVAQYEKENIAYQQAKRQTTLPGYEPKAPVPPKAPTFTNVKKPGTKVLVGDEQFTEFPADAIRGGNVKNVKKIVQALEPIDRVIDSTFKDPAQATRVKAYLADPVRKAVTDMTRQANTLRTQLTQTFKALKIKKGSKADYAAADYIEGKLSRADLIQRFPKDADNIIAAAQAGRKVYSDLLKQVNRTLEQNGYKPIPERANYVTHTQQIATFSERLGNFLNGKADTLPTEISGINVITKPGRRFFGFGKQRVGGSTHEGLVTALDKYIDPSLQQAHLTPAIRRVRAFSRSLGQMSEGTGTTQLSNFRSFLELYANNLAGKANIIDRGIEQVFGRGVMRAGDWLRRKTGANAVGGNVSSALTNFIPVTQFLSTTPKRFAIKGFLEGLFSPFKKNISTIDGTESAFITRRFPVARISRTTGETARDFAGALFKGVDEFTANSIVSGKYYEGLAKGMSKKAAMGAADSYAARVMADRSLGQTPIAFNSKTLGVFTQFQLEVQNGLSFITKDIPKNLGYTKPQAAMAMAKFAIYSYLFNEMYEKTTGRRPQLDPLHAMQTIAEDIKGGKSVAQIINPLDQSSGVGEIVNNLPFTSIFTGGRIPIGGALPNPLAFVDEKNKNKSAGKIAAEELAKPLTYLLPPFGGSQVKKTIQGAQAFKQGASVTGTGQLRFLIEKNPTNFFKTLLFGQYAPGESVQYFKDKKTDAPLTSKSGDAAVQAFLKEAALPTGQYTYKGVDITVQKDKISQYANDVIATYSPAADQVRSQKYVLQKDGSYRVAKTAGEKSVRGVSYDALPDKAKVNAFKNALDKLQEPIKQKYAAFSSDGYEKSADSPQNVVDTVKSYIKGFAEDPGNTWKALWTDERLRKVINDTTVLERKKFLAELDNGDKNSVIDHIIPLSLGGANNMENLRVIPTKDNQQKTSVETYLLRQLKDKKIGKDDAQRIILQWVSDHSFDYKQAVEALAPGATKEEQAFIHKLLGVKEASAAVIQDTPKELRVPITQSARKYNVPDSLLSSILKVESGWNPKNYTRQLASGTGIAQFTGIAIQELNRLGYPFSRSDAKDPKKSIAAAAFYLGVLKKRKGSWKEAVRAYNGNNALLKSGVKVKDAYVQKVFKNIPSISLPK